jgi:predicted TIM-barrel fold metal-dependent hydrolase
MHHIVDGHVHLWTKPRPGWQGRDVPGFPFPAHVDGSVEALFVEMEAHGVVHAIAVESPWWVHDGRYLIEAQQRFPNRITAVGCTHLHLAEVDLDAEAGKIGHNGLHGLRVHVSGPGALDILAADKLDGVCRRLADLDLPLLLLSRQFGAHELFGRVARRFPSLPVVLEHLGFATPPFGATPAVQDAFLGLSANRNMHVKLALHHQHSAEAYPWADVHAFQRRVIDAFGPQRCFWGSNWPMKPEEVNYTQRIETVSRHFPFRDATEKEWIMGRTATGLWPSAAKTHAGPVAKAEANT